MKKINIRLVSLLLCAVLLGSAFVLPGSPEKVFPAVTADAAGNFYMINGKALSVNSVDDPGTGNNTEYIKALYKYVWGMEYTDDFSSSDNILKNMLSEERALTPDNLKVFVQRCQPGAVLKAETINALASDSDNGHSVFIVSYDNNGFNVFERTDERKESYYTWERFCEIYSFSTVRFIKWPNSYFASSTVQNETDYKKPDRTLYYDAADPLFGEDVRWVQQKLTDAGFAIAVDGYYGKKAEQKVKEFQEFFSLSVTGIVDAATADMLEKPVKIPDPVELRLNNKQDAHLSRGDILTVSWEKVRFADSYKVMLYNNRGKLVDELDKITGNEASFVLKDAGTYTVKACAQNELYTGRVSTLEQKIKVHNTFTVQFLDEDGTLLNKQSVAYGMDAATPASPKKTGYSFVGWDQEYTNVTSAVTAKAKYARKTFTVTFVDPSGNVMGYPQKVLYGNSAVPPDTGNIAGFVGWNRDFSFIENSITVKAVASESAAGLPVKITNAAASREEESSGYTVTFTVVNNTDTRVVGRAVVALKTTAGKFLTLTESSAFVLRASENGLIEKNMTVFVPYSGAATVAEIYIVENFNDLVPISEVAVITEISTANNYTDWLPDEQAPETYYSVTDYRTEYSYREKEKKESKSKTMTGYTQYNSAITSYNLSGWSDWSATPISSNNLREVKTKSESWVNGYNIREWNTQKQVGRNYYRHYWDYDHGPERISYGQFYRDDWVSTSAWYEYESVAPEGASSGSQWGYNKAGQWGRYDWEGKIWFAYNTTYGSTTYYSYQDKIPVYTYYYYRWKEWSDWDTKSVTASDDVEVRTRQTRRYEVNDPTEVNTGKTRTIAGAVDASLAGKQATLFIYKIGEASDYTNEYVGQTMIGDNGNYRFTFKLREEPSVDTGDFTVTLGVEGTNTVFELEPIKAPLKVYTVNICDFDGTIIDTQTVKRGESASLPTVNPERPGYTFAGWNYSNASIYEDTTITALYVQDEYTVVFIDWTNELFEIRTGFKYGDLLTVPSLNTDDAYRNGDESLGVWQGVTDGMVVTGNMVVTAEYQEKTFTVRFYDYDKNIISEQEVKFGQAAEAPQVPADEDYMFISWDNYDYNFVTKDIEVEPVYCFTDTVEKPTANLVSGVYSANQTLVLNCTTANAVIWYSINGSAEMVYTKPITISATSEIEYYASALGANNSEKVKAYYVINKSGDESNWKYPVTVYKDNAAQGTYLVGKGATIVSAVPDFDMPGYDFDGYFKDAALTNAWSNTGNTVNASTSLYAKVSPKTYTVRFQYENGTLIEQKTAEYMGSVEAPENVATGANEVFIGWNTDSYTCVTGDIVVEAIVRDKSQAASVTLNKTELTMISGMSYDLVADVSPEDYKENTIIWSSSDENVVTVDDKGTVTAVAPGSAKVSATLSGDTVFTAICSITVYPNKSEDICVLPGAKLRAVDDLLVGILPGENTVSDVLAQIDSDSLAAYSGEGRKLDENDALETGATVCLVDNNGKILDALTVVVTGDVNADGVVSNKDAAKLMRYMVNKEQLDDMALIASDANADGHVSLQDVAVLQQYLIGLKTAMG
ncbi:MAG: InlB B-repeat-containing protein [Clostridia bacterium]|nr:InlB B-repeat-containing protein [Clostridia bacterium]